MKKENEFYLGLLRNPNERITDWFYQIKETEVLLYKDFNDYREVLTKEKVLLIDKMHVFDGHQFMLNQAGFIGRIKKPLSHKEAMDFITDIRENKMAEYVETIYKLIEETRILAEQKDQEYAEEVEKFKAAFRK